MKSRILATAGSLMLLTAAGAFAQSATVMRIDIPFEFRVGNTVLPPGQYDVRPEFAPTVVSLRCWECKAGVIVHSDGIEERKMPETGKLVFNRYGDRYFLSSIWTPGYPQGRLLHQSKAEREMARNGANAQSEIVIARR